MEKLNVKVAKVTQNLKKTGYVTKLVTEKIVNLGIMGQKSTKVTYYISIPNKLDVDTEFELDMSLFNIVERESNIEDENGNIVLLKWLHLR